MSSNSFIQQETSGKTLKLSKVLKRTWPYLWQHRLAVIFVLLTVFTYAGIGRLLPYLFGFAIDAGIKKDNLQLIFWIAGLYLFLEIARSCFSFVQNFFMRKLGNRVMYEIRDQLMHHIQRLPIPYFDKNPVGRTVTRVTNDISSLGELLTQGFTFFFVNIVELIAILIALLLISPQLTAISLIVAPLLVYISVTIGRRMRILFQDAKTKLSEINAFTAESLNGIKVIQLFGRTENRRKRFSNLSQEYRNLQLKTVKLFALLWPLLEAFNLATVVTALFVGGYYQQQLGMSVGKLGTFILLLQSFFWPLRIILERYNQMQNSLASADRVFSVLDQEEEDFSGHPLALATGARGAIEYRHLSFRYSPDSPYVLKDIQLSIRPGESVALVGRTGSGKSTMVSLIQKFYPYQEGEILIDGEPLSEIHPHAIRRRIGVVQQEAFIFRGTIGSNISLDQPDISKEQILEAARRANCDHIIQRDPRGLDAPVEERGNNLSVGERQLIAFARILAFNPEILILDEATANIDSLNEVRIQKATEEITKERTSLIIAHRLSTILHCDRIVLLDEGKILEQGSHKELLKKKGAYWRLYNSQLQREKTSGSAAMPSPDSMKI